MNDVKLDGGCQCGAVRYRISGAPIVAALCHCSMCRRANAAPLVAWAMCKQEQITFLSGAPASYASSPGARRSFCAVCGTQLTFTADFLPGLIDITIGSLDRPEALAPTLHYWDSRRLPWMSVGDELPRFPEFPPLERER